MGREAHFWARIRLRSARPKQKRAPERAPFVCAEQSERAAMSRLAGKGAKPLYPGQSRRAAREIVARVLKKREGKGRSPDLLSFSKPVLVFVALRKRLVDNSIAALVLAQLILFVLQNSGLQACFLSILGKMMCCCSCCVPNYRI